VLAGVGRVGDVAHRPFGRRADAVEIQVLADPGLIQADVLLADGRLEDAVVLRLARQDLQGAVVHEDGDAVDFLVDADHGLGAVIAAGDHVGHDVARQGLTGQGLGLVTRAEPGREEHQEDQEQVGFHGFLLSGEGEEVRGFHGYFSFLPDRNDQAGYWKELTNFILFSTF